MGSAKSYPIRFTPKGLSDAYDATDAFPGACRTLQNLVFDQSNPEIVVARPGVGVALANFGAQNATWGGGVAWGTAGIAWGAVGFISPTAITLQISIGNYIYGMVSSAKTPGYDEPFVFQVGVGFLSITGVTNANVPLSPSTSGDWTAPTGAVIGSKLIITHTGFSGTGANFVGVIDLSNPAAPAWSSSNTATHALPSVPTFVANLNNRAYYVCGNVVYYSDVLVPLTMTNASQSLTIGDTSAITALSGLPVQTTSAGVVSALIVFKAFQIWQITGDAAVTGSLSLNYISLTVGCSSPGTVVQTPIGTIFIGIDGAYVVSPLGQVSPLTKDISKSTQDVQQPFQNIVNPTRAVASFSGPIYRVCLDTVLNGTTQTVDYWFDITRRRWTGPHTFPYDTICQIGNYFVIASRNVGAMLFLSQYRPSSNSVYSDNGVPVTVVLESSSFPKTSNINEKQVVESTIELSSVAQSLQYIFNALSDQRVLLNQTLISISGNIGTWGGGGLWGGGGQWAPTFNIPATYTIPWAAPIVFKKLAIQITAQSNSNLSIGTFFAKYQDCGYINK